VSKLTCKWQREGHGFSLGKLGGELIVADMWKEKHKQHIAGVDMNKVNLALVSYLDDMYMFAHSLSSAQHMMNDLTHALGDIGLTMSSEKVAWMGENIVEDERDSAEMACLKCDLQEIGRVKCMKVLGSMVDVRGEERGTYEHRIASAWKCYWKWKHILESEATLACRLEFWRKTVEKSLLWGLQTTRHTSAYVHRLASTQKMMIRKMIRIKRQPMGRGRLEPWVDWQVRSLRIAADIIGREGMSIGNTLHELRLSWAGHIARFGLGGKDSHLLKVLLLWRNRDWWQLTQIFNDLPGSVIVQHWAYVGKFGRWR
jgi:hypothetical protein